MSVITERFVAQGNIPILSALSSRQASPPPHVPDAPLRTAPRRAPLCFSPFQPLCRLGKPRLLRTYRTLRYARLLAALRFAFLLSNLSVVSASLASSARTGRSATHGSSPRSALLFSFPTSLSSRQASPPPHVPDAPLRTAPRRAPLCFSPFQPLCRLGKPRLLRTYRTLRYARLLAALRFAFLLSNLSVVSASLASSARTGRSATHGSSPRSALLFSFPTSLSSRQASPPPHVPDAPLRTAPRRAPLCF